MPGSVAHDHDAVDRRNKKELTRRGDEVARRRQDLLCVTPLRHGSSQPANVVGATECFTKFLSSSRLTIVLNPGNFARGLR